MKKTFLNVILALLLIVVPFGFIGCAEPDGTTGEGTGQVLTLEDYHNEINKTANYYGYTLTDSNVNMALNTTKGDDSFSPNLRFFGPVGNYGDFEVIYYNNLARTEVENKLIFGTPNPDYAGVVIDYSICEFGEEGDTLYSLTLESREWVSYTFGSKEENVSFSVVLKNIYDLIDPQYYTLVSEDGLNLNYKLDEEKRELFNSVLTIFFSDVSSIGDVSISIIEANKLEVNIEQTIDSETTQIEYLIERGGQFIKLPEEAKGQN